MADATPTMPSTVGSLPPSHLQESGRAKTTITSIKVTSDILTISRTDLEQLFYQTTQPSSASSSLTPSIASFVSDSTVLLSTTTSAPSSWVIDSGAILHVSSDSKLFSSIFSILKNHPPIFLADGK